MRAVGYIRVSDPSQVEGYSLDAQERYFTEYCESSSSFKSAAGRALDGDRSASVRLLGEPRARAESGRP